MGLSKKAISTIAICCLCCILLGVLVALGYSGKTFVSSLSICVMTNAITGIYSYAFSGKKSFVFIAMLSFAINMAFLILRIKEAYPKQCTYPSDGELVGTITEIQDALNADEDSVIETIADDIETLKSLYLPVENLLDVQCESGEVEYVLDIPSENLVSAVSVREDIFGNVTLDITEGAYHDILVVKVDGTILLNGSEVIVTVEDCECTEGSITLAIGSYRCSETSTRNYSPTSVYTLSSTKKVVFDFGDQQLKNVAISSFTTILGMMLGAAIGGDLGAAVGTAVGYFASNLLSELKSVVRSYCPSSTAAGCILSTYNSHLSNALDRYYKYMGSYYANYNKNTGSLSYFIDTVTFYGHNYFC